METLHPEKRRLWSLPWSATRGESRAVDTSKVRLLGYVERSKKILELCRNRRTLHLGCAGFTDCPVEEKVRLARKSLHHLLSQVCDCVGVDIDQRTVHEFQRRGIFENVVVGDAERLQSLSLNSRSFDVVVAGDIIEHLSNPGRMLEGVKELLKPNGLLVVSTPNAMGLPAYLRFLTARFREGEQHVISFNAITLFQLLSRHTYQIMEAYTCHQADARQRYGPLYFFGRSLFQALPKFGGTLLYVSSVCQRSAF